MTLSAVEQAFAEAAIVEGLVPGPKMALAIKVREAGQQKNKVLPNYLTDLKLLPPDQCKRLWALADAGVKASPLPSFSFSAGAMMGPYVLVEPRGPRALAGEHWRAKRPEGLGFLRLVPPGTGLDVDRAQRLIDRANAGIEAPDATILRVDDAGEEFNWLYVGSIGFDGESLATRTSRGPIAEREAITILATIAQSLRVAHGFGVVHGGLNPLAVLFGSDGTPRVTDFGIGSTFFDGAAAGMRPGQRLGLLLYAAPELIHGGAETGLDARADLYAAGALVYEAVAALRAGDVRAPDSEPWVVKPPVSEGLATVLRRLLALQPEQRYANADALLQDLERVRAGGLPGPLVPAASPVIVPRPPTAAPLPVVTAELLQNAEASATTNLAETAGGSLPESVGSGDTLEPPLDDAGFELAPPTIDPDAAPASGEAGAAEEPPPTDDPDRPKAKPIKSAQKTLSRRHDAIKPPQESKGLAALLLSLLAVAGAVVGARIATAPDGALLARRELLGAYLAFDKDHDWKKAKQALDNARAVKVADDKVLLELSEVEGDLRRRRIAEYVAARKSPEAAEAAAALLKDTDLECLHTLDVYRREQPNDAKLWLKCGTELLAVGLADEAVEALQSAFKKDSLLQKDRDRALLAAELGAFLPAGKYAGGKAALARSVYVGRTPVTRAQYADWLVNAKDPHALCPKGKEPENKSHAPEGWDPKTALATGDPRPATGLDLWDALAYARARGGRLATAGERLAAAEGRGARPFPWGVGAFSAARANAGGTWGELLPAGVLVAGRSPSGALDLLGNAEEWAAPETDDAAQAPVCGADFSAAADALSLDTTSTAAREERKPTRGFRCALDVAPGPKDQGP